ncbi:NYN domain-containing protein [Cryobacterium sp. TMT1-3]|uniref:NYN domain-containing protein n=1 Tax=Cryobacterium sp. TMT1-3 TaxID=1259237 RepID=UPI001069823A|nr:NYN domain-containing protein [Cryobacterium sp. TMT1-3]TFC26593.1 NYN domain-containing protein [Cryobacterium sp. TMT1-3]
MRSHSGLYIDAGYLIAAAATRLTGSSLRRGVDVDYAHLLADLIRLVEDQSGLPILRVYWYDAARDGVATPSQELIALLPKVKLRLGRVGVEGEQKGVDLRIGLDMVGHSRNGAVDTMYLLSGDDDLTEAVEEAQALGVQVTILAVPARTGGHHGISRHLILAADDLDVIDVGLLDASVRAASAVLAHSTPSPQVNIAQSQPSPADIARVLTVPPRITSAFDQALPVARSLAAHLQQNLAELSPTIEHVATKTFDAWATTASDAQKVELRNGRPSIPRDLDRALLVDLSGAMGEDTLSDAVRVELRAEFWDAVDRP